MWFKNLIVYRLPADWAVSAAELEDLLAKRTLQPCSPFDMISRGWVAPAKNGRLLHTVNQQHLIALGIDQKLLPGSIIRQVAQERAEALAQEQGYPVGRRQMRDLKTRVTEELRARALTRRRVIRAWIDPLNGWFVVDAAGAAKAEELTEVLRVTLGGSFAVTFMETARSSQQCMTTWLTLGDAPLRFTLEQDLELQSSDATKATIRYTRHPLDVREVQGHLKGGKHPTRLGLTWSDRVAFVLTDKMQVKRLEFLDMTKDTADGGDVDAAEQFDIDFAVMAGELAKLLDDLGQALGGEVRKDADSTAGVSAATSPPAGAASRAASSAGASATAA
jgi:recombination associated protein RdgC